jgi:flagellar capping protein FliD
MTEQLATAIVSASAAVITAVVALILSYRGFTSIDNRFASLDNRFASIENRLTSLEARVDRRFDAVEADLKEFFRTQAEFDKRLARIEDKLGIPPH